jgi:two-component system, NarL family, invasion response regulator UvrY
MIRILIADDHAVVREGLRKILSEHPDMTVLAEAENSDTVLALVRDRNFDIVILDISMPGRSGLDVLRDIRIENPRLPVLILSMFPEEQFARRVLKAGASGYMTKGSATEDLIKAIRKISAGGKYISPSLAEQLATELESGIDRPTHEILSDREFQVFMALSAGKPVTEIANELSLSAKTVTTYRTRILEKMNLKTNADLTRYAIQHHLIE